MVSLSGVALIAYLWNGYSNLREENERLQREVSTLLGLLERYLNAEKMTSLSPARAASLEEILFELRQLRSSNVTTTNTTTNTTTIGQSAQVGQASAGQGNQQEEKA